MKALFRSKSSLELLAALVVVGMSVSGCSKSKDDGAGDEAAKAEPAEAPSANEEAAENQAEDEACVRAGTYQISSEGPFYVLEEGKLPPPDARKEKVDEIQDCGLHASLKETVTVAMDGGEPKVTFGEESPSNLVVSDAKVTDCTLTFSVKNEGEPYMLDQGVISLDFSGDDVKGQLADATFEIKLDGEAGENIVSCGTDQADLDVAL